MLEVNNLSCFRNEMPLFKPVSFTLENGQALLLSGPNGCGKTSLLRILTGLSEHEQGQIHWMGDNIRKQPASYKCAIGYIGHHPGIKLELTVSENLTCVGSIQGKKQLADLDSIIARIDLEQQRDLTAGKLSAGQRKRLALGQLIMFESSLWILDEPQSSLDAKGIELLEHMIEHHLDNQGMAIVTTHQALKLPETRTQRLALQPLSWSQALDIRL